MERNVKLIFGVFEHLQETRPIFLYREPNEQHKNNNSRFLLVSWRTFVTGECLKKPGKLSKRNAQNVHIFLVCLAFLVFKELNNTILKKLTV